MSETTTEAVQYNVQEVATDSQNQEPTNPEVGNLIAESKKYRSRAQEAEAKLAELESIKKQQEEEALAKNNEWESLANKRQSELDAIQSDYERLKNAENAYKEELLDQFPEEEREAMKSLTVEQLRIINEKVAVKEKDVPDTSSTPARATNPTNKNWVEMNAEERRANWGSILQSYVKR